MAKKSFKEDNAFMDFLSIEKPASSNSEKMKPTYTDTDIKKDNKPTYTDTDIKKDNKPTYTDTEYKTARTELLMKPSVKETMKILAKEHKQSLNDLIGELCEKFIKEEGADG